MKQNEDSQGIPSPPPQCCAYPINPHFEPTLNGGAGLVSFTFGGDCRKASIKLVVLMGKWNSGWSFFQKGWFHLKFVV